MWQYDRNRIEDVFATYHPDRSARSASAQLAPFADEETETLADESDSINDGEAGQG